MYDMAYGMCVVYGITTSSKLKQVSWPRRLIIYFIFLVPEHDNDLMTNQEPRYAMKRKRRERKEGGRRKIEATSRHRLHFAGETIRVR